MVDSDQRRLLALGALGALASLLVIACDDMTPYDYSGPDSGSSGDPGYGGSGSSGGYDYDAGSSAQPEGSSPEAEAAAPHVPPISATPPASPPSTCAGGAAPSAYVLAMNRTVFAFDPSSLAMRSLGVVSCETTADPWRLTVTSSGTLYLLYDDGDLFELDPGTLACKPTAYEPRQLGPGEEAITVGAGRTADRLYVYANYASPTLGVSDLSSFRLFQIGAVAPGTPEFPVDLKSDAYGRLFAFTGSGALEQLDPATGAVLGRDYTGSDTLHGGWALLTYDGQVYLFGGDTGGISRYDLATKTLLPLGQINQPVVAAAATPCLSAAALPPADAGSPPPASDAGSAPVDPDAGPGPADPDAGASSSDSGAGAPGGGAPNAFSPGDAWIGTFVCPQGLMNLAVVVESVQDQSVRARFDFDWNDGATQGSYELTGRFDPATREATFVPGAWVSQPSTWPAVGLDGYVDLSGTNFAGNVTATGCGAFSVTR